MPAKAGAIRAGRAFVELFADDSKLVRGLRRAQRRLRGFQEFAKSTGRGLMTTGGAVAAPFILATKIFAGFSDEMLKVKAVTQATPKEFERLNAKAKELGRTTSFTASQVAGGMVELGRAGFDTKQIDNMIGSVLSLARATDTELPRAAEIAGAAMRGFNIPAAEAGRVADVLTNTANNSAQGLEDIGEGMKDLAPLASESGDSLEETAALLGILANNAIKGSKAGNAVARAYKNVSTAAVQSKLKEYGVDVADANDNMKPMAQILGELGQATDHLGSVPKLALFDTIFGRGQAAALKLTNANFDDVLSKIKGLPGAADRAAAVMDSGVGGSIRRLISALEGIAIAIGESVAPMLSTFAEKLSAVAGWITKVVGENQAVIRIVLLAAAAAVGLGAAFVTVGIAASVLNAIIGLGVALWTGFGLVLTSVIALFGLITSPVFLLIAGIAELGRRLVDWGGVSKKITTAAGDQWNTFRKRASGAWGGIVEAVKSGDLGLAFRIVTLFLKSEWLRIVGVFQQKWNAFVGFFQTAWAGAVFTAARIFTNAFAGIQSFWLNLTSVLADGWAMFTGFVQRTWNTTVGFLAKAWETLKEMVTGKRGKSSASIDAETERANRAVQSGVDAKRAERERERKSRLGEIESERVATMDALGDEQRRREQERADANQRELDDIDEKLRAARDELSKSIDAAKGKRKKQDAEDDKLAGKSDADADGTQRKFRLGQREAGGKKIAIEGTMSAFDRFAAAGRQDPQLRVLKKIEDKLDGIKNGTDRIPRRSGAPNL